MLGVAASPFCWDRLCAAKGMAMKLLKRCVAGAHYTLQEICHGQATISPHPPKFDPTDRRGHYRRVTLGLE
jgi:rRNA maturation protein Nop10